MLISNWLMRFPAKNPTDASPKPSDLKDSASCGWHGTGPLPCAIIVLLMEATTHPKVSLPDDGLCPPSDANSNVDPVGWISPAMSSSGIIIVISPVICDMILDESRNQGMLLICGFDFPVFQSAGLTTFIVWSVICKMSVGIADIGGSETDSFFSCVE